MADPAPRLLVAGAINTDLVAGLWRAPAAGETVTGDTFAIYAGGKGANQAVAARRAGVATALVGAVGSDDFGASRLSELAAEGIAVEHVAVRQGATSGVALIFVEEGGENRIAYVPGASATVTAEEALDALSDAKPTLLLCTLELPGDALHPLLSAAYARGVCTVLCASPEPEAGRPLLPLVDVLVVNEGEAAALLGVHADDLSPEQLLDRAGRLGPTTVVLTLGKAGAVALVDARLVREEAIAVEVVDTTGAGDAFAGAFVAALAEGRSTEESLRRGVAAGGLATTKEGAQPSMPLVEDIERLLAGGARDL